jgi:preprotein translocase subunit SecA
MHVQVLAAPAEDPDYAQAAFEAADDPVAGLGDLAQVPAAGVAGDPAQPPLASPVSAQAPPPSAAPRQQMPSGALPVAGPSGRPPVRGTPNRGVNGGGAGQRRPPAGPISPTGTRIVSGPPAKVGRNEPCWCGSGRKFKVCHGAS